MPVRANGQLIGHELKYSVELQRFEGGSTIRAYSLRGGYLVDVVDGSGGRCCFVPTAVPWELNHCPEARADRPELEEVLAASMVSSLAERNLALLEIVEDLKEQAEAARVDLKQRARLKKAVHSLQQKLEEQGRQLEAERAKRRRVRPGMPQEAGR